MPDQPQLRLSAEVVDRFSGPLKRLRDMLGTVKAPGGTRQIKREFDDVGKTIEGVRRTVAQGLTPALGALGVTSLSVAGAMTGVGVALKSLVTGNAQLARLAVNANMTADALRQWEALGNAFGLSADTVDGAAQSLATNMRLIRRNWGEQFAFLYTQGGKYRQFALDLAKTTSNDEALAKVRDFLNTISDAQERYIVAEKLLGNGQLGIIGSHMLGPLPDLIKQLNESLGQLPRGATENAVALELAFSKISASLDHLKNDALAAALPPFTELVEKADQWVKANEGDIASGIGNSIKVAADALKSADWQEIGGDISAVASAMKATAQAVTELTGALSHLPKLDMLESTKRELNTIQSIPRMLGIQPLHDDEQLQRLQTQRDLLATQAQRLGNGPDGQQARDTLRSLDEQIKALRDKVAAPDAPTAQKMSWRPGQGRNSLVDLAAWSDDQNQSRRNADVVGRAIGAALIDYMKGSGKGGLGSGTGAGDGGGPPVMQASYSGGGFGSGGGFASSPGVQAVRRGFGRGGSGGGSPIDVSKLPNLTNDPLLNLILKSEGTSRLGYNDSFAHQLRGMDLTSKSIGQIMQIQRGMHGSSAIGAFQFMRGTLNDMIKNGVVKPTDQFSPANQRKMAEFLIERRLQQARRQGGSSQQQLLALAQEWASFPTASGRGFYPGQRAAVSPQAVLDALRQRQDAIGRHQDLAAERPTSDGGRQALRDAHRMGVIGGGQAQPGNGALDITLHGFPRQTRTRSSTGGLFPDVRLNRGRVLPMADAEA